MIFVATVSVVLKPVVNDPQGIVVRQGLQRLGFAGVQDVRVGKHIEVQLEARDEDDARQAVTRMCEQLLRNPVIEDHHVESIRTAELVQA